MKRAVYLLVTAMTSLSVTMWPSFSHVPFATATRKSIDSVSTSGTMQSLSNSSWSGYSSLPNSPYAVVSLSCSLAVAPGPPLTEVN